MELAQAYDLLLLPFGSTLEEVKRAYHGEAQLVHPDKLVDLPLEVRQHAEERFKQLNEAYQKLTDYIEANGAPLQKKAIDLDFDEQPLQTTIDPTENDRAPTEPTHLSPNEAMGVFMAQELGRRGRIEDQSKKLMIIVFGGVFLLNIIIRSCAYYDRYSYRNQRSPAPTPVDTTETP